MKLIVNNIELSVNNAYTERDNATSALSAVIEVPYESCSFTELKELFMENTGVIAKILDDGSTESWDGFSYSKPPVDTGEQYQIILSGNEETYQIERLRHMERVLAEKEAALASVSTTVAEQAATIASQEEVIASKSATIAEKESELAAKNAEIAELTEKVSNIQDELNAVSHPEE